MEQTLHLRILLLVLLAFEANSKEMWSGRTWQTNLNYNDSRNWNIGRVPCESDKVVFQSFESVVLEIPEGKTFLRELVLPSYTEIVLPRDGIIQFTGKKYSPSCIGHDAVFKPTGALKWIDPINWDKWNKATPDLERTPCITEKVRFPFGATVKVLMPDVVRIGRLEINGVSMDSMDWFEFVNTGEGARQFYKTDGNTADLEISGHSCDSSQWCECGNEYLRKEMCSAACPLPFCKQPVQPSNFCCPICGAYFLLQSLTQNKSQLTGYTSSFLKDKGILWHASKVGELIQVVLVEEMEYNGKVPAIAEELKNSIVNSGMDWTVHEFYASGHTWYPTTFSHVVRHFFSLMIFAAFTISAIVVVYSRSWSFISNIPLEGRPFVFARFENQTGEVVMASEQRQSAEALPKAFDNPMYGATNQEQSSVTAENHDYTELEETSNTKLAEVEVDVNSTEFSD